MCEFPIEWLTHENDNKPPDAPKEYPEAWVQPAALTRQSLTN